MTENSSSTVPPSGSHEFQNETVEFMKTQLKIIATDVHVTKQTVEQLQVDSDDNKKEIQEIKLMLLSEIKVREQQNTDMNNRITIWQKIDKSPKAQAALGIGGMAGGLMAIIAGFVRVFELFKLDLCDK